MLRSIFTFLLFAVVAPAQAGACTSFVASVCAKPTDDVAPGRKVLRVTPDVAPFAVGDRFPVESQSLLMDPARYDLRLSDGTWRYYARAGVVYRVENTSGVVLEVIRDHRTSRLR